MRLCPPALGLICALLSACTEGQATDPAPDNVAAGQRIYAMECTACHGADAAGGVLPGGVVAPDLAGLRQRHDGYFPPHFGRPFGIGPAATHNHAAPPPRIPPSGGPDTAPHPPVLKEDTRCAP